MATCHAHSGVPQAKPRVVDVLRRHASSWLARNVPSFEQRRLLRDITVCRTAALGGHDLLCTQCGHVDTIYNSCRNRHCPSCQALSQARWIEARQRVILPVGHHHVVFTLPAELRSLARRHPRDMYGLLLLAVRDTLTMLADDMLDGQLGITTVLHTWTRELSFHPQVHCIVTAGALSRDGSRWIDRSEFLFPAARMKAVFRGRVLAAMERSRATLDLDSDNEWNVLVRSLPPKDKWVVHIQPPFGRSSHVVSYLGRYTHRVAISDARLVFVSDDAVCFSTRDDKTATLSGDQFIDRFMQHVLPSGFHKIRHFGLYAPGNMRKRLIFARALLGHGDGGSYTGSPQDPLAPAEPWHILMSRLTGHDPLACPHCGAGHMVVLALDHDSSVVDLRARGP